jgi:metal transporter CNNM
MVNPGVWVVILLLISLSATFSGLTLGLLSLDLIGLEIIIASGSPAESKYFLSFIHSIYCGD